MIEEEKTIVATASASEAADGASIAEGLTAVFDQLGFELLQPLGSGGMADVFMALETELGRRVAIKVMRDELATSEELRTRFVKEAQRAAKLEHNHILTLFRAGTTGELRFIVMQLATEGDLKKRIESSAIDPPEAIRITEQLASALAYAHDQGIVHRDVKPGNVFFSKEGEPQLADFGIAKSLVDPSRTQLGSIIGTPRYMSPEQAAGQAVDGRTDVYALGLVFFEMLTQDLPTSRTDLKAIRNQLPGAARHHAELIYRCLSNNPAARPPATEIAAVLAARNTQKKRSPLLTVALAATVSVALVVAVLIARNVNDPIELAIDLQPADARVYLDGREVSGSVLKLADDSGELALVKRGYIGQLLEVHADEPALRTVLTPLMPPDFANKQRFHERFDDESAEPDELVFDDLTNPIYRDLLQLKRMFVSGQSITSELESLRTLASLGDDAAALKLFLAASVSPPLIAADRDVARSWVAAASNGDDTYPGYGLASYYRALGIFQERGFAELTARDRTSARDLMARSYFQGLKWPQTQENLFWYIALACNAPLDTSGEQAITQESRSCVTSTQLAMASCLTPDSRVDSPPTLLACLRSEGAPI
ncbi:MAG: serine/threonine-protein kinase [Pseudomonadota bacterium]